MTTKRGVFLLTVLVFLVGCLLFGNGRLLRSMSAEAALQRASSFGVFDVRAFGAKGNGKALDSPAVNKAIDAAAAAGGGTVRFSAGTYRCFSIRLKSNVALYLDQGSTILAADPKDGDGKYDDPEPNQWDPYQDFGHSHWHNSLIWGENLENISILGPGRIWGKGLVRSGGQSRTREQNDAIRNAPPDPGRGPFGYPNAGDAVEKGWGNKSISLKLCRNVIIRDISILHGGHFAILATGVDNLTIDNLKIDTNRDGIDVDACKNVRISNCTVNSPFDDGICPKSSFALGYARVTENVTITNCQVSGYDEGTLLDGTYKREFRNANGTFSPTGRIKFGTESNGGFKNIAVSNCVFDYCRGLALEAVDGALLEDVTISNITMRDISNSPIFVRLGFRGRGPKETTTVGAIRRVNLSDIVVYNADPKYSSIISGIPGHSIEDLRLNNIRVYSKGGGTKEQAALDPPEKEDTYPEPTMFGELPAYGFFVRHVKRLQLRDVEVSYLKDDFRPAFWMNDVVGVDLLHVKAQHAADVATFDLRNVSDLSTYQCWPLPDMRLDRVAAKKF
ncbi:MAG TPA: glycoside hydrolase family 28 protein [Pyrinomonadaceae bacterium]|jgi:polygalacturonase|nr:glycoside hydrolase family 28 protein [Pyrinomonadaceae bacterium]